ncbi:MAG: hypothetical protein H6728_07630 [Myxococcales bacterium]|nr:hypothetical protein [Myxococcales bacterium]
MLIRDGLRLFCFELFSRSFLRTMPFSRLGGALLLVGLVCGSGCTNTPTGVECHGDCKENEECVQEQFCLAKCATQETRCGVECVDTKTNKAHCGACSKPCQTGEICAAGTCKTAPTCASNETLCIDVCADTKTNKEHCGACGTSCKTGESCVDGACEPEVTCTSSETKCQGACVDTQTNNAHCGQCDNKCAAEMQCEGGSCKCKDGKTACNGQCVDTSKSDEHCGACNNACGSPQYCDVGQCVCPTGQRLCGTSCVDINASNDHCGACGNVCPSGTRCTSGACACPNGGLLCDSTCVDSNSDVKHCGGCNKPCDTGEKCSQGTCKKECATSEVDCSGSCVDLNASNDHCGACNNACKNGKFCDAGNCKCPSGQVECDGTCVDTASDAKHCGACGNACSSGDLCKLGVCRAPCSSGLTDCSNSCVDTNTSLAHCGACNNACASDQVCNSGTCRCPAGWSICGGQCVDTNENDSHCGVCGTSCGSGKACRGGKCQATWVGVVSGPKSTRADGLVANNKGNAYITGERPGPNNEANLFLYQFDNTGKATDVAPAERPFLGFHADLNVNQAVNVSGWTQIKNWRTSGTDGLFNNGGHFDGTNGEFTAPSDGYYHFRARAALNELGNASYMRLQLAIDGNRDVNNGFHAIRVRDTGTYNDLHVMGTIYLKQGQKVTLWVQSANNTSYTVMSESGFSGYYIGPTLKSGFHADLSTNLPIKAKGWTQVKGWRTAGTAGLFQVGNAFDGTNGEFTAPADGYYHFDTQVRLDETSVLGITHYLRLLLVIDGAKDINNGMHTFMGIPRSQYLTLNVSATVALKKGQKVTLWVYSHEDNDYVIQSESGFSGYFIGPELPYGAHASLLADKSFTTRGWGKVTGWRTSGVDGLFANSSALNSTTGNFVAPVDGYYALSAQIRFNVSNLNSTSTFSRCYILINDNKDLNNGLGSIFNNQYRNEFSLSAGGTVYLQKGHTASVWIYSDLTNNFAALQESGFSVHFIGPKLSTSRGFALATDNNDSLYVTGSYTGLGAFPEHLPFTEINRTFLAKRKSDGTWEWALPYSSGTVSNFSPPSDLQIDNSGSLYLCGNFSGTWQYSPTKAISTTNYDDGYVAKIDSSGVPQWAATISSSGRGGQSPKCAPTPSGAVYVFGRFRGAAQLGSFSLNGNTASSAYYHYLARIGSNTLFAWAKEFKDNVAPTGIVSDANENLYVLGTFDKSLEVDTTTLTSTSKEIFVMKIDQNGQILWTQQTKVTSGDTLSHQIALNSKGVLYITASFDGQLDLGTTSLTSKGKKDLLVAALDSLQGRWIWAKQLGSATQDETNGLFALDSDDNTYLGGSFFDSFGLGTFTVTPQNTSASFYDTFVTKNLP